MSKQLEALYDSQFRATFTNYKDGWYSVILGVFKYSDVFTTPYNKNTIGDYTRGINKYNTDHIRSSGTTLNGQYISDTHSLRDIRVFITDVYDETLEDYLVYVKARIKPNTYNSGGKLLNKILSKIGYLIITQKPLPKICFKPVNSLKLNNVEWRFIYNKTKADYIADTLSNIDLDFIVIVLLSGIGVYCVNYILGKWTYFLW